MRNTLRLVTALALILLAGIPLARAGEGFGRLTVDEVSSRIGQKDFYVFDNNSRERWTKGHVPSARWVDYSNVTAADLPADKEATLVFYCGSEQCTACHKAAATAIKLGYKKVNIMPSGIAGWEKSGKKTEPGA